MVDKRDMKELQDGTQNNVPHESPPAVTGGFVDAVAAKFLRDAVPTLVRNEEWRRRSRGANWQELTES